MERAYPQFDSPSLRAICVQLTTLGSSLIRAADLSKAMVGEEQHANFVAVHALRGGRLDLLPVLAMSPHFNPVRVARTIDRPRPTPLIGGIVGPHGEGLHALSLRWVLDQAPPGIHVARTMERTFLAAGDGEGLRALYQSGTLDSIDASVLAAREFLQGHFPLFDLLLPMADPDHLLLCAARAGNSILIDRIAKELSASISARSVGLALGALQNWPGVLPKVEAVLRDAHQRSSQLEQMRAQCTGQPVMTSP